VDDMIISSNDTKHRKAFLSHFRKKLKWKITETGKLARFVGITCSETEHPCGGKIWAIAAPGYIDRAVERFKMQDAHPNKSLMEAGFIIGLDEHDGYVEDPKRTNQCRSLMGTLNFACTACRFDVAHAISVLSRHLNRPTDRLLTAAYRVLQYLKTTRDFEITYTTLMLSYENPYRNFSYCAADDSFLFCPLAITRRSHLAPRQINLHEYRSDPLQQLTTADRSVKHREI